MNIAWGAILEGVGSAYGGIASYVISLESASLLKEQGALAKDDYYRQAALIRDEGTRVRAKQAMDYVSSGVELSGSPLLVLKETFTKSRELARSYEVTGENVEELAKKKAKIAKQEGIARMVSGLLGAGGAIAGGSK